MNKDLSCTAGVPHNVLDVPAVVNDRPEDKILIDVVEKTPTSFEVKKNF